MGVDLISHPNKGTKTYSMSKMALCLEYIALILCKRLDSNWNHLGNIS